MNLHPWKPLKCRCGYVIIFTHTKNGWVRMKTRKNRILNLAHRNTSLFPLHESKYSTLCFVTKLYSFIVDYSSGNSNLKICFPTKSFHSCYSACPSTTIHCCKLYKRNDKQTKYLSLYSCTRYGIYYSKYQKPYTSS